VASPPKTGHVEDSSSPVTVNGDGLSRDMSNDVLPHRFFGCPVPNETEPEECTEPETSSEHRFDRKPIKLERRGVTSHDGTPRYVKPRQGFLFAKELVFKESIVAKLDESNRQELADKIRGCHTEVSFRQCQGCRATSRFWNRCDVKWCPICAEKLARERRESVEWWTHQIKQPKHVVLTMRNTDTLTVETVQRFKNAFARLRRRKFAQNWNGGFYSLEVTNESRGWHLHLHTLIDARWIDGGELARQWAECIGQDIAIVAVKDCRGDSYLKEVTKYAVKGSDFAAWSSPDIIAFVEAFENVRTFGVFGSLYKVRTEWKEFLDQLRSGRVKCDCGCNHWRIMSEAEFKWETEFNDRIVEAPRPPPARTVPDNQLSLV
jgi:hypothetical protein